MARTFAETTLDGDYVMLVHDRQPGALPRFHATGEDTDRPKAVFA